MAVVYGCPGVLWEFGNQEVGISCFYIAAGWLGDSDARQ